MKISRKTITMGLLTGLLNLFGCINKKTPEQTNSKPTENEQKVSFENQLKTFQQLNFNLNKNVEELDINRWPNGYKEFEETPFSLMYMTLGQEIEREPFTPLTNKCWDFDTEAIEDHGAYIRIIQNLERITRGELKFYNIKDFVDIEKGKAWVSFTLNEDNYKWDMKVNNDWVDADIFPKIVSLTNKYNTKGKFTYFNTGGQNAVIGYETTESFAKIKKATGLKIE
jgi:hypothetical protein